MNFILQICIFSLSGTLVIGRYFSHHLPNTEKPRPILSPCPNAMCIGKRDGNYESRNATNPGVFSVVIKSKRYYDYYLKCIRGRAYCLPCSKDTFYSPYCNQCLKSYHLELLNPCHHKSLTPKECPSKGDPYAMTHCALAGGNFTGNLVDSRGNLFRFPRKLFISCWNGEYVGCSKCGFNLVFKELINYRGNYDHYGHCGA